MSDLSRKDVHVELLGEIETFEELEAVLVLTRARDRGLTLEEIAVAAQLPPDAVRAALARLCQAGLAVAALEGRYLLDWTYRHSAGFDRLLVEYDDNRLAVLSQMSANALDRVRTAALRAFSKAFVLRKHDDG